MTEEQITSANSVQNTDKDDDVFDKLKPSDIKDGKVFAKLFAQSIGMTMLKLFVSRQGTLVLTDLINGYILMWMIALGKIPADNQVNAMIMFSVISIIILTYFGFLTFEKIKASIEIKK